MAVTDNSRNTPTKKRANNTQNFSGKPSSEGSITSTIGSGDNAKNSFIWLILVASFSIGSILSAALYARSIICELGFSFVDDLKSMWSIFVPIVTLALGYSFGKGQK